MTVRCKTHGMFDGEKCPDSLDNGALCGMTCGTCAHEEILSKQQCEKCGGEMRPSRAIEQTWVGAPDLGAYCTLSPGGSGRLIDCRKCIECGWSVTI